MWEASPAAACTVVQGPPSGADRLSCGSAGSHRQAARASAGRAGLTILRVILCVVTKSDNHYCSERLPGARPFTAGRTFLIVKARAMCISTVTLPSTLMGRLMPTWRMRKPRLRGVAGETWKVLGFHVVTLLLQWLWLVAPDLLRGKRRSI